ALSTARFDNTVGFYAVEDTAGTIIDPILGEPLRPGDEGYRQSAIANRIDTLDMTKANNTAIATLETGQFLAPFLVANSTPEKVMGRRRHNMKSVYFAFEEANADGVAHVRGSGISDGTQAFSFEDRWNGGRKNTFDDVIVNVDYMAV
ncbi:MAG: DUF4114 domain-containing protein, partial [Cyanobacteria bacterium J06576_12]